MYERKDTPHQHASGMTAKTVPPYHHGHGVPVKIEQRAESPTLQQSFSQDCTMSPVASSQSAPANPLASEKTYNQQHLVHHSSQIGANRSHPNVPSREWKANAPNATSGSGFPSTIRSSNEESTPKLPPNQTKEKQKQAKAVQAAAKKRQNTKVGSRVNGGPDRPKGNSVTARRQKRLERNRESARLSRRRRKQYLEVLEDRVSQLSLEVDKGRREHAARAIDTVLKRRQEILQNNPNPSSLPILDIPLNRTSSELSMLSTFYMQQLKSFSLPPHSKFILWLTLQGDTYFRGGRAASERLSAARIGERMLISGNDKVPPASSMWPLVCNEVGLSYDQEERVRNFQRNLLQTPTTWLDRHTSKASGFVMQSFHDSMNTVAQCIRQREHVTSKGLTAEQRLKFAVWAEQNADRIKEKIQKRRQRHSVLEEEDGFQLSSSQHVAANLYILNHRLQKVISSFPKRFHTLAPASLKRLSRRPSFESLGQQKEEGVSGLTREGSFASSGSLKSLQRSSSSLSMNDPEKPHPQQVSPEDGQKEAEATLERELGFVKSIIPPTIPPTPLPQQAAVAIPTNLPRSYHPYNASQTPTPEVPVSSPQYQYHPSHASVQYGSALPPHPHQGAATSQTVPQHPYNAYSQNQQPQYYHPYHQAQYHTQDNSRPSQSSYESEQKQQGYQKEQESQEAQSRQGPAHVRKSSFLPPHLNVVPEEMFPSGDGAADDFFMSLIDDEDWAIGEGVDMDATT